MALGAGFVAIAAVVLALTLWLLHRASAACGDPPAVRKRIMRRFLLAALAWVGVVLLVAATGVLRRWDLRPPPLMGLLLAILVLGVVVARSAIGDRLARGATLASLVGLQAFRLPLELLMHRAATEGVMPAPMSYSGWNFDVLTGATAAGLGLWLRAGSVPAAVVWAWNIGGLALLINIVTIAVASTPLFAAFGTTPDRLNTFVTRPPYVLLPAVMVLAAWAGHLVVFKALRVRGALDAQPSTSISAGSSM